MYQLLDRWSASMLAAALFLGGFAVGACGAEVVPHHQDRPPGPALSPAEAIAKMTVPEGFHVELVASEPDIVNPVAMTFDERGRVWITESLEYPRQEAGPGRDRIKVLEDTDGDGRADRFTVFADGFNIPSGIAVGYGGVWVANAPDILFLKDTDGDGRADQREVVVTGFGRDDTHELPNSLTWGPDGWLYGLNGVFNSSTVEQNGKHHEFTCALFRIHPRTREFQLFAEGTSNPWGIAWDPEGSAFVSACVIDHLWHLVESAYYIRQGGPYPPFTKPMNSIVHHKHQKAAYCGIHYFDSEAYPREYRGRLYMGNIHGNCINVDVLSRDGSTYVGNGAPDFLTANDAWFMPVVQKTGPDGCLYVLDWYDRYHCYQDARRDPPGIDRLKGRLYRIRYGDSPRAAKFDLATESDDELIARLHSPNVFFRDIAQRVLSERHDPETMPKLEQLVLDPAAPRKARMHALWALVGGGPLSVEFHQTLLSVEDSGLRAWGVRAAGNLGRVDAIVKQKIVSMTEDPSADVRLQVAIAASKLDGVDPLRLLLEVLRSTRDNRLIEHVVWQNLHPLLDAHGGQFFDLVGHDKYRRAPGMAKILDQAIDRVVFGGKPRSIVALIRYLHDQSQVDYATLTKCFNSLTQRLQHRELTESQVAELRPALEPIAGSYLADQPPGAELHDTSALLAAAWHDPAALARVREMFDSKKTSLHRRAQALQALIAARDRSVEHTVEQLLAKPGECPVELRRTALEALGDLDALWVADNVVANYNALETELRPKAVQLLCERRAWAERLLDAVEKKQIPAGMVNANQLRQLLLDADPDFAARIKAQWGSVREQRDPQREQVINQMRAFLRTTPGDPVAGQVVFKRVCGQCHKLHGAGEDVGPDITLNGRNSFEQLLSNVFDPSLVIGASYQARIVVTADGRVLTGLVAEDSPQRIVLKMQGGKQETIARRDVEVIKTSPLSLMPEDLEKQCKPQELADLFALLTLDKPPSDPSAKKLPGSQPVVPRSTNDPAKYDELVGEVAPGFSLTRKASRPMTLAIVAEHAGRVGVLRTRPSNRANPCELTRTVDLPHGKRSRLVLNVSHEAKGAWELSILVDGVRALAPTRIGDGKSAARWRTISVDLTDIVEKEADRADNKVKIRLIQRSVNGKRDAAFWDAVEIVSQ